MKIKFLFILIAFLSIPLIAGSHSLQRLKEVRSKNKLSLFEKKPHLKQSIVSTLNQKWNGTAWVNAYQILHAFDTRGDGVRDIYQNWANGAWLNDQRHQYVWNLTAGELEEEVISQWNESDWIFAQHVINKYEGEDWISELKLAFLQNAWVNLSFETFGESDDIITVTSNWQAGAWVPTTRLLDGTNYDDISGPDIFIIEEMIGTDWAPTARISVFINDDYVEEAYIDGEWVNSFKLSDQTISFGEDVVPSISSTFGWKEGNWVLEEKSTYSYDSTGLPLDQIVELIGVNGVATPSERFVYNHSDEITGDLKPVLNSQTFYINQSDQGITVRFNEIEKGDTRRVYVYDMKGEVLYQSNSHFTWDYTQNNQPVNAGLYFLKVKDEDRVQTHKIVVD